MLKYFMIWAISVLPTALSAHPGVGIVMDSRGNVFFTDLKNVLKIDGKGKVTIAVANVHTHELYIDAHDNLFGEHLWYEGEATNKWGHYVWTLSPQGQLRKVIPDTEGFLENYGFVRDHAGNMFYADRANKCQHVLKIDQRNVKTDFSKRCFTDIRWMTSASDGTVYLIDQSDVVKLRPDGRTEIVAKEITERAVTQFTVNDRHLAMGLWTDNKQNVYAAIFGARKVKKISPDKKVTDLFTTGVLWSPTGGLTAPNGDFWLLECSPTNDVRVEKISKDGSRTTYENL